MSDSLRDQLLRDLGPVMFADLRPHLVRDRVIVIDKSLDLVDVGEAVAKNEEARIAAWIERGLVGKPSVEQVAHWSSATPVALTSIVVQPFVLVRESD